MPPIRYYNAAGQRVPSVTTINRQGGWGRDGLVWWANKEGLNGNTLEDARRAALDVGNLAHAAISDYIHGVEMEEIAASLAASGLGPAGQKALDRVWAAFTEWTAIHKLDLVASEQSLVSETHQYGGTFDVATLGMVPGILDVKTSKKTYAEHLVQVRAYGHLWHEVKGEQVREYHILRLGKKGGFHWDRWDAEDLQPAWEVFLRWRDLYALEKELEGLL